MLHPLPPQQQTNYDTPHQLDALSIFLVTSGRDCPTRLLFRYPYTTESQRYLDNIRYKCPNTAPPINSAPQGRSTSSMALSNSSSSSTNLRHASQIWPKTRQLTMKDDLSTASKRLLSMSTVGTRSVSSSSASTSVVGGGNSILNTHVGQDTKNSPNLNSANQTCNTPLLNATRHMLTESNLVNFPDDILANLFGVHRRLCADNKFELKVDDVRFVGHPVTLDVSPEKRKFYQRYMYEDKNPCESKSQLDSISMVHVCVALSTNAHYSVVKSYHQLMQLISNAIRYEERRIAYLSSEARIMVDSFDEGIKMLNERLSDSSKSGPADTLSSSADAMHRDSDPFNFINSPYDLILKRSALARNLKKTIDSINSSGIVELYINNWCEVSYCLPQKVHKQINSSLFVQSDAIYECLNNLKPYHALMLLQDTKTVLNSLPKVDADSHCFRKVILEASPVKSFKRLAYDCDIAKQMVFRVASQLIYWGKATVIYPLCERNLYCISPYVPNPLSKELRVKFHSEFNKNDGETSPSDESLERYLTIFSSPVQVGQTIYQSSSMFCYEILDENGNVKIENAGNKELERLCKVIVWCLQHHILIQLHTYINLAFHDSVGCHLPDPVDAKFERVHRQMASESESEEVTAENGYKCPNGTILYTVRETNHDKRLREEGEKSVSDLLESTFTSEQISEIKEIVDVTSKSECCDITLLIQLAPYFCGRYHMEEIMYHENVSRSSLVRIIDKFRDILITFESEDPAVTMYFKKSIR